MTSLYSLFADKAEKNVSKTAVIDTIGSYSYKELQGRITDIASQLASLMESGRKPVVALCLDPSFDYVASMLAVLQKNGVFFPVSLKFPDIRITALLAKSEPDIIITTEKEKERLTRMLEKTLPGAKGLLALRQAPQQADCKVEIIQNSMGKDTVSEQKGKTLPEDACYIMSTSGSTGDPKLILGSQKGLAHFIQWEVANFNLGSELRSSFLSHVTFDVSLRDMFVPLSVGGTLIIPDDNTKQTPHLLHGWLEKHRISLVHIVPTVFRLLINELRNATEKGKILPDLEYLLIAGEALFSDDILQYQELCSHPSSCLVNIYGPSETTLAKFFHRVVPGSLHPGKMLPLGQPLPDTQCYIIKDDKLCKNDEVGEICIHTPFMSHGYYGDEALNKAHFVEFQEICGDKKVYRTGDLGRMDAEGNLVFMGRMDNQLKLYGNRIEVTEIEHALRLLEDVKDAAVTTKPDQIGNQRLIAYYILESVEKLTVETLRARLARQLPDYMIPSAFVVMDELPLTPSLKVNRKALPDLESKRPELEQDYIAPQTELEKRLQAIWQVLLGVTPVGTRDNFFSLGGTSLLSMHLVASIKEKLSIDLSVVDIFQYPTIAQLANRSTDNTEIQSKSIDQRAEKRRRARTARIHRS